MIRIMVMNGLLISLILIWTSSAKEPSAGNLIKSSTKPSTGPLNYSVSKPMVSLHETNKEILSRKFVCGSEFGGVCVNKKKSCPSNLPSEKSPGKPYCSNKKHRCCYPDPTTAAPPTVVPTTTTTSEDVNWSDIRNACIKSNNYKTYQPLALDICKEKCVEEDAINCQSIEYSSTQQMCAISEARSDSDDFIEPCFVDGWIFAEIELNTGPTTGVPTTAAPSNTTTNGPTTGPPTTLAPSNTTINVPTTGVPTTTAPSNTTTNVSCNLVWNYEEDRPLIMIRETKIIVPPIIDKDISEDPNRIPEGKKLIFACPGENNQFNHVQGTHTKLHGECISHEQFKVCVNNYPEILDLSQLSCSSKMQPSIIKQDNDTSYEKSCEDIGGELYKFGYIYGDYREFKDLDTKFCFREKDQTTLWTSTNIDRIEISPSMRSMDPANFRTARGLAMNTFYSQKSQQETLKEILDKEVTSVWNDKACRNHGGHCVRGGRPCPKHLPHHTSQGEPFCTSFYRCCYSEQCDPTTCIYKGQKGICSLDSLPGTTGVGSQECKKGCRCYIKDNKTLQFKSSPEQKEFSKLLRGKCGGKADECTGFWKISDSQSCVNLGAVPTDIFGPKGQCCQPLNECASNLDPPGLWIPADILGNLTCSEFGAVSTNLHVTGGQCCRPLDSSCKLPTERSPKFYTYIKQSLEYLIQRYCTTRKDCILKWDYVKERPIVVKEITTSSGSKTYQIVLPNNEGSDPQSPSTTISHGDRLIFVCTGLNNQFDTEAFHPKKYLTADCINGRLFIDAQQDTYSWREDMTDMGCCKTPISTIHSKSESCGHENSGNLYYIAFEIFPLKYYNLIDVCFRTDQQTTLWTKNMIHGKSMSFQDSVNTIHPWVQNTPGTPFTFNINDLYLESKGKQEKLFSHKVLGKDIKPNVVSISYRKSIVFSRGHLAPRSDFVTKAGQMATFLFTNTLPQWQPYNGGNWALIEKKISKLAQDKGALLEIYTGGSDIMMTKPKPKPGGVGIFLALADEPPRDQVPIPNLFWKVVIANHRSIKKAVAFVGNNNPIQPDPASPCAGKEVCELLEDWIGPKKDISKLVNSAKGIIFCCEVSDLKPTDFPNIPNKDVIGTYLLLDNLN